MMRTQAAVYGGAILFALLVAAAGARGLPVKESAGLADALKLRLLSEADLLAIHNEVAAKTGEEAWDAFVKPDFLQAITWRTIEDSGRAIPEAQDVVNWVRLNPEEARQLLRDLGGRYEPALTGP